MYILYNYVYRWVIFLLIICQNKNFYPMAFSAEQRLLNDILSKQHPSLPRPVVNSNSPVIVNMTIGLSEILDLAEKNQTLLTNQLFTFEWYNPFIEWPSSDYEGIDKLIIIISEKKESLWLPDIHIVNNAANGIDGQLYIKNSRLLAKSTGQIVWRLQLRVKSSCSVNIAYFPYDNQNCSVVYSSLYDIRQMRVVLKDDKGLNLYGYKINSQFELLNVDIRNGVRSVSFNRGEKIKSDDDDDDDDEDVYYNSNYSQIVFSIYIQRKPLYYAYTILAPTIVLSVMTLFTFFLPCNSGEKVAIGLTVFLSLYLLQLAIAKNIPESNSLPLISLFLILVMTFNALTLIMATVVINIHKRDDGVPYILWKIAFFLAVKCFNVKRLTFYDYYDDCGDDDGGGGGDNENENGVIKNEKIIVDKKFDWFLVAQVFDNFLLVVYAFMLFSIIGILLLLLPYLNEGKQIINV